MLTDAQARLVYPGSTIIGWTDSGEPIPAPIPISLRDLPPKAFMSHVMVAAGHFESVSDARKAGWNAPAAPGVYSAGKRKRPVEVVE